MKGDTVGSTNLHLACNDRLLVGAVHADLKVNEYSTRKGVTNKKLQVKMFSFNFAYINYFYNWNLFELLFLTS